MLKRVILWGLGLGVLVEWLRHAWTAPRDWTTTELVSATIMNTHVRDNLNALKDPPSADYVLNEGSDYSGAGAGWADVDSTNLSLTLVTGGGDVMVHFHGMFWTTAGTVRIYLDVEVDGLGNRTAGNDGIIGDSVTTTGTAITFTRLITGLAAGSHTFDLQWNAAAVHRLAAGAGTANFDVHPQFWAREIS